MKMVVAGSRFFTLSAEELAKLDAIHAAECVTELVSGGAEGVDQAAEAWAEARGIRVVD
jgi:predicted Rossmann fold nucleotide-binding protein DprA/Smf involved in DNA uptake